MSLISTDTAGTTCPRKQNKCMAETEPEWMSACGLGEATESMGSESPGF